jgi:hypothetical protein
MGSGHANDLGGSEGVEAVDEGDADLDFGGLAVWVSCGDAITEGLEAPHLRLDPASDTVSRPSPPERPAIAPGGAQSFVSGGCRRADLLPRPTVLANWDDRRGPPADDGSVATAGVLGAISGHGADFFTFGGLVQQLWQNGAVTVAAGRELHRPDVGCGGAHRQMHLAPLASALRPMLARLPFAIAQELDASAVHEQVQRASGATVRDLDGERLLPATQGRVVRHGPVQVCQLQQAGNHPGRLPERQLEQDLDGQTELDRRIREYRRATRAAVMWREPGHVLVLPDQQRPTLAQRR